MTLLPIICIFSEGKQVIASIRIMKCITFSNLFDWSQYTSTATPFNYKTIIMKKMKILRRNLLSRVYWINDYWQFPNNFYKKTNIVERLAVPVNNSKCAMHSRNPRTATNALHHHLFRIFYIQLHPSDQMFLFSSLLQIAIKSHGKLLPTKKDYRF